MKSRGLHRFSTFPVTLKTFAVTCVMTWLASSTTEVSGGLLGIVHANGQPNGSDRSVNFASDRTLFSEPNSSSEITMSALYSHTSSPPEMLDRFQLGAISHACLNSFCNSDGSDSVPHLCGNPSCAESRAAFEHDGVFSVGEPFTVEITMMNCGDSTPAGQFAPPTITIVQGFDEQFQVSEMPRRIERCQSPQPYNNRYQSFIFFNLGSDSSESAQGNTFYDARPTISRALGPVTAAAEGSEFHVTMNDPDNEIAEVSFYIFGHHGEIEAPKQDELRSHGLNRDKHLAHQLPKSSVIYGDLDRAEFPAVFLRLVTFVMILLKFRWRTIWRTFLSSDRSKYKGYTVTNPTSGFISETVSEPLDRNQILDRFDQLGKTYQAWIPPQVSKEGWENYYLEVSYKLALAMEDFKDCPATQRRILAGYKFKLILMFLDCWRIFSIERILEPFTKLIKVLKK